MTLLFKAQLSDSGQKQPKAPTVSGETARPIMRPTLVRSERPAIVAVTAPPHAKLKEAAIEPVAKFIDLEIEARQCGDLDSLRFAIVNSPRQIAPYQQAVLVELDAVSRWRVSAASSVAKIDRNAPFIRQLEDWLNHTNHTPLLARGEARSIDLEEEARRWDMAGGFAHPHALWLPIKDRKGRVLAGLLAMRDDGWKQQHTVLLLPLAGAYGHAWSALAPQTDTALGRVRRSATRSRLTMAVGAAALLAAFLPVSMSALAPAEVVAAAPALVTSPIDGVIGEILVAPGAWVEKGTPIVRFVDVKLRSDAELARRNKSVAEARHFKVMQTAISTQRDMQDLATTKAELDVAIAELAFADEMLQRTEIRAERAGLLIYSAKSDWLGKPVAVGERLMEIGDPANTELKIELPVSDAIVLHPDSRVALFLDGDPLRAVGGTIKRTAYRPTQTADQQLAFRLHAKFDDNAKRRIGLRGIARVEGEGVPMWFYLLRRPISAVRQRIGL